MSESFHFKVNGEPQTFEGPPMTRLIDVLREALHLTGTKEGCGEGECGTCTVLLDGLPVNACLVPVFQLEDRDVVTIEGVASKGELDEVQQAMLVEGAVQCGTCTPAMVLTIRALLDRYPQPTRDDVRDMVSGTLCRCTGYERIFRTVEVLSGQPPAEPDAESQGDHP